MSSDRTPAEALARARWDRELEPDHPWHVAWDDVSPRLRQEQVELAEADIELLAAAGFQVTRKPDDNTRALADQGDSGTLADRLRLIADDMMYGRTASTHSDACWQWHESCALHRAADLLDGQPQDRPAQCPTCGSDDPAVRLAGCRNLQWELDVDPWHGGGSGR